MITRIFFYVWLMIIAILLLPNALFASEEETDEILLLPFVIFSELEPGYYYNYDLHVMELNSGKIIFSLATRDFDCPSSISPNNQWLLYSQGDSQVFSKYTLYHFESETTQSMMQTGIANTMWSPDSHQLAIMKSNYDSRFAGFYVFDFETGYAELLTDRQVADYQLVDGQWVILVEDDAGVAILRDDEVYDIELPSDAAIFLRPLSPNGDYIAYRTGDDKTRVLYLFSIETGESFRVETGQIVYWDWSPDGSQLAYASGETIYLYDADSRTSTQELASSGISSYLTWPKFSPDGSHMIRGTYAPNRTNLPPTSIELYDLQTGERELTVSSYHDDGVGVRWINPTLVVFSMEPEPAAENGRFPPRDLWLYDLTTRQTTRLTDTPEIDEGLYCMYG